MTMMVRRAERWWCWSGKVVRGGLFGCPEDGVLGILRIPICYTTYVLNYIDTIAMSRLAIPNGGHCYWNLTSHISPCLLCSLRAKGHREISRWFQSCMLNNRSAPHRETSCWKVLRVQHRCTKYSSSLKEDMTVSVECTVGRFAPV